MLFHTVRELLFNVVKHAEVDRAQIVARPFNGRLRLEVRDQGRGFRVEEARQNDASGQGLRRIEQRLHLFGGHTEITSAPGKGTVVILLTPVTNQGELNDQNTHRGG
mgnify:CR=1 FL=1